MSRRLRLFAQSIPGTRGIVQSFQQALYTMPITNDLPLGINSIVVHQDVTRMSIHLQKTFYNNYAVKRQHDVSVSQIKQAARKGTLSKMDPGSLSQWEQFQYHLKVMCTISRNTMSGESLIQNYLTPKVDESVQNQASRIKDMLQRMGFDLISGETSTLDADALAIAQHGDSTAAFIQFFNSKSTLQLTATSFNDTVFLWNPNAVINMVSMTCNVRYGMVENGHYGQRVNNPGTEKDPKIFYSPVLLPNGRLPQNFDNVLNLYRQTNTGNVLKTLQGTGEISLYWITAGHPMICQEVIVKEKGSTGFCELTSSHESKQCFASYNAKEEIAVLLDNGTIAILPFRHVPELNERCRNIFAGMEHLGESVKVELGYQVAQKFVSELAGDDIRVYKNGEQISLDKVQETLPSAGF